MLTNVQIFCTQPDSKYRDFSRVFFISQVEASWCRNFGSASCQKIHQVAKKFTKALNIPQSPKKIHSVPKNSTLHTNKYKVKKIYTHLGLLFNGWPFICYSEKGGTDTHRHTDTTTDRWKSQLKDRWSDKQS